MIKQYWFKNKRYGWGWLPATWQGWLVLLGFLSLLGIETIRLRMTLLNPVIFAEQYTVETILFIVILLLICLLTGEKPGWHWGNPKKKK